MVAVTSASGSVTNSYTYDPFGVITETKALFTNVFNPWRYAGQYHDTTARRRNRPAPKCRSSSPASVTPEAGGWRADHPDRCWERRALYYSDSIAPRGLIAP